MKDKEMQEHLIQIFKRFSMRTDLISRLYVDLDSYIFRDDVSDEDRWGYYLWVCKELKIKDKIIRSHGMKSEMASSKKKGGHDDESFFKQFGYEVNLGTNKTDLLKDGESFASLKGGEKIQWGMHTIDQLPQRFINLFRDWISTYETNSLSLDRRKEFANEIINKLNDKETLEDLLNYYFRKCENVPYLIVKDVDSSIYYRIDYFEFIKVLVNNIEFYTTEDKVKINARINIGENKKRVIFEIEPRTDKGNSILMHGLSKRVINIIKHYKIDVKETYKQDTN